MITIVATTLTSTGMQLTSNELACVQPFNDAKHAKDARHALVLLWLGMKFVLFPTFLDRNRTLMVLKCHPLIPT